MHVHTYVINLQQNWKQHSYGVLRDWAEGKLSDDQTDHDSYPFPRLPTLNYDFNTPVVSNSNVNGVSPDIVDQGNHGSASVTDQGELTSALVQPQEPRLVSSKDQGDFSPASNVGQSTTSRETQQATEAIRNDNNHGIQTRETSTSDVCDGVAVSSDAISTSFVSLIQLRCKDLCNATEEQVSDAKYRLGITRKC